ncbi:MAG: ParB N-terminal domain-containing protein [Methylococcales bacterium]
MANTNRIENVDYQKLHLDIDNPRLPSNVQRTAKGILTWIAKSTAIEDLMNAIGTNDFFAGEPLVVYPHPKKSDEYIVIEGNRRLTAVKLLHNPAECDKPSSQMCAISQDAEYKPEKIPVVIQANRAEVLPYLGFRHITGIEEWQPLAKAKYLKQLFDLTNSTKPVAERYSLVARTIGSRKDAIKRSLDALAVYTVIEDNGFFDIQDLGEESIKFSVLSTALANEHIAEFVGSVTKVPQPQIDLFPESTEFQLSPTDPIVNSNVLKKSEIEELTRWLFEKKDGKKVVSDSRQLSDLGKVIATPKALAAMRNNSSLAYAFRLTTGVNDDFISSLYTAQSALEQAAGLVANVDYDEVAMELARELNNSIKQIGKTLKDKRVDKDDDF